MNITNYFKKGVLSFILASLFVFQFAFAATNIVELLSTDNLVGFFQNLEWLNWVIYVGLVVVIGHLIQISFISEEKRSRANYLVSILVSFIGVTGFFMTLLLNDVLPLYFVFFGGEILILGLLGKLLVSIFQKTKTEEGETKEVKKWAKIGGIGLVIFLLNQYHLMLDNVTNINLPGGNPIGEGTLLDQIVSINFEVEFWIFVLIVVILAFFWGTSAGRKTTKKGSDSFKSSMPHLFEESSTSTGSPSGGDGGSPTPDTKEVAKNNKQFNTTVMQVEAIIKRVETDISRGRKGPYLNNNEIAILYRMLRSLSNDYGLSSETVHLKNLATILKANRGTRITGTSDPITVDPDFPKSVIADIRTQWENFKSAVGL
jgi:hypothetical protein